MTLIAAHPELTWRRCTNTNCLCPNHKVPSYSAGPPDTFFDDPAFYHMTRTNNAPGPSDEADIQRTIAHLESTKGSVEECTTHLKALRAECQARMDSITTQLKTLEKERERLGGAIKRRRDVLSPLRRLPPEVLCKIFMHAIDFPAGAPPEGSSRRRSLQSSESILWTIELVCKRWRRDVLDDHSLWSFVSIYICEPNFPKRSHRYLSRLARQLSRTHVYPLSVCISHWPTSTVLPAEIPIFILPFAHRIKELYLKLPPNMIAALSPLRRHFRHLTSLFITNTLRILPEMDGHQQPGEPAEPMAVFDLAPKLRVVHLADVIYADRQFALPWDTIHVFSSMSGHAQRLQNGAHPAQLRRILDRASALESASLLTGSPDVQYTPSSIAISHNLVSLRIFHCHPTESRALWELFDGLRLPSLRSLNVHDASTTKTVILPAAVFASVVDVVEHSQCPLCTLTFPRGETLPEDIIRLLRAAPTLEALQLGPIEDLPGVTNEVIREMTIRTDYPIVAPRLHTLHMAGCLQFDADVFLDLVASRRGVVPFRDIVLVWVTLMDMRKAELEMEVISHSLGMPLYSSLSFEAEVLPYWPPPPPPPPVR